MLEIFDSGRGFSMLVPPLMPVDHETGRGLAIVWNLCGEIAHSRTLDGARVSVILPVRMERRTGQASLLHP